MIKTWLSALFSLSMLHGCAMAEPSCFSKRPSVVLPDKRAVLANLSTGEAGRQLVEAIWAGELDRAEMLLRNDPRLLTSQVRFDPVMQSAPTGQYGDLLSFAVARCDIEMLAMLLENGMPPDGVQRGEALILALLSDAPDMADLMLRTGASPDPQKQGGKNVVYEVAAFGADGAIQTLIRHRLDTQWVDQFGNDHLDTALSMEQYRIAEHLVRAGAKLWRINAAGTLSAWTLNKPPILQNDRESLAARDRLLVEARKNAPIWPPPDPRKVRQLVLSGEWGRKGQDNGPVTISPEARSDIETRFTAEKP
jgi:hypothetical protein